MSVVAAPLMDSSFAATVAAPPDRLWRRVLASRRAVWGGGGLLFILLLSFGSLPWTRFSKTSSIQYNLQHDQFSRIPPSFGDRPADMETADWNNQQAKLADYESHMNFGHLWRWLGTDTQARSLLGRCLFGGVISLSIGFAAAAISVALGVTVGLVAGYRGGWVDTTLMRIVDVLYGLPYILLVILFRIAFEQANSMIVLLLAIGLVSWLTMARVVRGQVLTLRAQPFIEAARAAGITETRIFLYHLLPNLVGPIIVYASLTIPSAILQESFLSFLGVGIQSPLPTWGSLASDGLQPALNTIHSDWWLLLFPCTLLAFVLLCLNFLGDGLRDVFDPRNEAAKI